VLTEAGRALLPRAQRILSELEQYRLHARRMTMGVEHELKLALHPFVSPQLLAKVLSEFEERFPSVHLYAWAESKAVALGALRNREADLAMMPELVSLGAGFEHTPCGEIEVVVAAAPDHPLAQLDGGAFSASLLRDYRQLVMFMKIGDDDLNVLRGHGMDVINIWHVMDYELQHSLLLRGSGWGALPRSRIADDVAAGKLVVLRPHGWGNAEQVLKLPFFVVRATNNPPGPAARWLFERFAMNTLV
jgi:DNA-binding transcriptional LysR family regulator